MIRSQKFSSVIRIAETKKRDAARVAVKAKQKLQEYEQKLNELRSFRSEYTINARASGQVMTANQLQERQKFIRQLDEGIKILSNKVDGQRQSSALEKQAWLDAHKHNDAVDKLMGKIRQVEINLGETREANELDDRSQHRKLEN
jgi:flagellar export protein FliJ